MTICEHISFANNLANFSPIMKIALIIFGKFYILEPTMGEAGCRSKTEVRSSIKSLVYSPFC